MPTWDVRFDLHIDLADHELLRVVYEAQALARVVHGIPLPPAAREQLNRLNIVRAVRGTTGIEGSDLTEDEVGRVLNAPEETPILLPARSREEREVRNARSVLRFIAHLLDDDPGASLTEEGVRQLHRLTTEGIPYPHNVPGEYRTHGVSAGEYVPPRGGESVRGLMRQFVEWLNGPRVQSWPPVVRAVAAHFYFISIHPFGDGNGRTARAIEGYLLYQARVNQLGFFSLANFYYRRRAEYIEWLDYTRFRSGGNLTPFVTFAAKGLLDEFELIRDEVLLANKRVAFRSHVHETLSNTRLVTAKVRVRLDAFMEALLGAGELSEWELRNGRHAAAGIYRGLSARTLTRDLELLQALQFLQVNGDTISPNYDLMDAYTRPDF